MKRLVVLAGASLALVVMLWLVWSERRSRPIPPEISQAAPKPAPTTTASPGAGAATTVRAASLPLPTATAASAPAGGVTPGPEAPLRKRPWDPQFLASLRAATEGSPIRFELVDGQFASGTIQSLQHQNGELIRVSGSLATPEAGRFFFQKQTLPGKAGDFVGLVEFPASKQAYRIEPTGQDGAPELVARPLDKVVCLNLPLPEREITNSIEQIPPLKPDDFPNVPIPDYQNGIVVLESLSGSTPVLYLDYQGGYTPTWGGITYDRPSVSNAQIRDVWKRVAEDYLPFNINVTTDLRVYQRAPENSRQRVIITPTSTAAPGAGGVAYVGSFNWTGDTPCWVFMTTGKACAEAASHEAGHTFGLSHDGQDVSGTHTEYYGGQGSGATGWAPIMGVGYYQPVSQWSKGEYTNANNHEDDIAIISTKNNNVAYRPDDTGATLATSRYLEVYSNSVAGAQGVIETTGDTDAFQFTTSGGTVSLTANPIGDWANLAIQATLADESDTVIASNNPQSTLNASIATNLPSGTYTFRVTGAGRNDPLTTGFSAYASLGYYSITGSVANARLPTRFTLAENSTNGTLVGVLGANNPGGDPLAFNVTAGNTGGAFAVDAAGRLTVANASVLDYEALARLTQLPVQFELFVDIVNAANPGLTETNRRVVVAITDVNEPPTATGFSASVLEHTQPGTLLGQVVGADPDFYTLLAYTMVGGASNGLFSIGSQSGEVRVAGDLSAAVQSNYQLLVRVSDQAVPVPLMVTSVVSITVLTNTTPFHPGTINYAVYTNLPGNLISGLTGAATFPYDPAFEKPMTQFEGDSNRGDNYGSVMRGFLIPPASGSYSFWIATDDNGELWMSTSTNPASMTRIAYLSGDGNWAGPRDWNKFATQKSAPRTLVAGQAYYIEARHKEGTGGDNLAVAWQCATAGIDTNVIPGAYLAPYPMNYVPHPAGFTANLHRDAIPGSRLGTVTVTDVNTNDTSTLAVVGGTGLGLFSVDAATGVVRVRSGVSLLTLPLANYTLQVRATDNGNPPRTGTATVSANLFATNAIVAVTPCQEIWTNIGSGTVVTDLTGNARYPKRPDVLRPLTAFDTGQNFGDNYGSRIRAYLTPTNSGTFTFFIASDDSSSLKFTPVTNNPAAATQIAYVSGYTDYQQWTKFASQKSGPIGLAAGRSYYLETLHKEGGGGDHVSVAWTGTGMTTTNVVAGNFLAPVDINYAPDVTGKTVQISRAATNGLAVTTLTALDSPLDTLAYQIVAGNTNNTFAIDSDSGQITLANNTLLASYLAASFSLTVQVQDSGYGGLYPLKSTQAVVNVQIVETPALVWTGGGTNDDWSLGPNWNGTAPTETSRLIFTGTNRRTNVNDLLTRVGPVAINSGGFELDGNPVVLLAGLSSTGDNTWALDSTLNQSQTFTNLSGRFTLTGAIDNNGNALTLLVNDSLAVDGAISGSGSLVKAGSGTLNLTAANPMTGPTTLAAGTLVLTGSGSLGGSPQIEVQSGSTLDVSGVTGGFTLAAPQMLRGGGRVLGDVAANGTVAPGAPIGTLTFSNALSLAGTTVLEVAKAGSALTNDALAVGGALTLGGTLVVTNIGSDALAAGDAFTLLSAGSFNGEFSGLILPSLSFGLRWITNQLAVDGSIRVDVIPAPQLLPLVSGGTNLLFQVASETGLTYVLQATTDLQDRSSWTGISTNVGTGGALDIPAPVDAAQAQQFFRLLVY